MTFFALYREGEEGEGTGKVVEEQSCPLVESRVARGRDATERWPPEYEKQRTAVLSAESQLDRVLHHRDGVRRENRNIRQISVGCFLYKTLPKQSHF